MSEIRYDFFDGEYALIAPERLARPQIRTVNICPFCPGSERYTEEIFSLKDEKGNWKVRVVPNLYKAVRIEEPLAFFKERGIERISGFGAHEIIIDTPRHLLRMDLWSKEELYNWLYVIQRRLDDLRRDQRLVYFSIFKNHGKKAGTTIDHPHSQIIALPIIPKKRLNHYHEALNFYKEYRENLYEALLKKEELVLIETQHFTLFTPFASTAPFEVKIVAKSAPSILEADIEELSELLHSLLFALYRLLGDFDFNILLGTPPMQGELFQQKEHFFRFSLTIFPRIFTFGGFEMESEMRINVVDPKKAYQEIKRYL